MKISDSDREAVKHDDSGMSNASRIRLTEIKENDRCEAVAVERFANAVASIEPTHQNLMELLSRLSTDKMHLEKRAHKLRWFLTTAGLTIGQKDVRSPLDLLGLSNISPDEERMSMDEFESRWRIKTKRAVRAVKAVRKKRTPNKAYLNRLNQQETEKMPSIAH